MTNITVFLEELAASFFRDTAGSTVCYSGNYKGQ